MQMTLVERLETAAQAIAERGNGGTAVDILDAVKVLREHETNARKRRDVIALAAMNTLLPHAVYSGGADPEAIAREAYAMADAMETARNA